jgi:hypothetical protein
MESEECMPRFIDHCQHGKKCFIETIQHADSRYADFKDYDIYVFEDQRLGAEVCIRYGNKPYEYISPGRITDLALKAYIDSLYSTVLTSILSKGRVLYRSKIG